MSHKKHHKEQEFYSHDNHRHENNKHENNPVKRAAEQESRPHKTPKQLESKIIAKAWKDPVFKKKLLSNPKAVLEEMGLHIPHSVNVRIFEDNAHTHTFILPHAPANNNKLSEAQLEKLAAAGSRSLNIVKSKGFTAID